MLLYYFIQILSVYRENVFERIILQTMNQQKLLEESVQALRLLGNVYLSIVLQILRRINMCMG